ncbi:unnamed protein product [Rotaria sp. Silwood1]|nr:unnamed protein product [Rotaria sp. Silwood1]
MNSPICGGMDGFRPLDDEDLEIWDIVELPDKTYATARVWHIVWQNDTHGDENQVAVHEKLSEDPNEDLGDF